MTGYTDFFERTMESQSPSWIVQLRTDLLIRDFIRAEDLKLYHAWFPENRLLPVKMEDAHPTFVGVLTALTFGDW